MKIYWKPLIGGATAALVGAASTIFVGSISGFEALVLLEAILPSTRFLCSAVTTASATILALLLTAMSLAEAVDTQLKPRTYTKMQRLALLDALALIGAVVVLLVLNVPLEKTEAVPAGWYDVIYYFIVSAASVLGGMLIAIVLLLYETLKGMTQLLGEGNSHLRASEPDSD